MSFKAILHLDYVFVLMDMCHHRRLEDVETSDEFYSSMGLLIQDVLSGNVIDCQTLMQVKQCYISYSVINIIWYFFHGYCTKYSNSKIS